jgi:hypothetical protein
MYIDKVYNWYTENQLSRLPGSASKVWGGGWLRVNLVINFGLALVLPWPSQTKLNFVHQVYNCIQSTKMYTTYFCILLTNIQKCLVISNFSNHFLILVNKI